MCRIFVVDNNEYKDIDNNTIKFENNEIKIENTYEEILKLKII